jgi:mannose-6-phosphate isomerase-like protein (cupin superfamily)
LIDKRGILLGLNQGDTFKEVNYLETKKGTIRGKHFHHKATEAFFISFGRIKVTLSGAKGNNRRVFIAEKGDFFFVKPKEYHIFEALIDSGWLNMYDIPMNKDNPDIHRKYNIK